MKGNGMTLIELLIVIGLIAILAGLIYPVLMTVQERARITYCVNSLNQVGAALHMYAQDHDDFVPPYTNYVLSGPDDKYLYLPNSNDPALFEAAYAPYTRNRQIWYCPLDPYAGMDTPLAPEGPQLPTWRGFYWNTINHKATSYMIASFCALKAIAPVPIHNPPHPHQLYPLLEMSFRVDWERWGRVNYAIDFTHGNPEGPPFIGIFLFFDGSVKVDRHH